MWSGKATKLILGAVVLLSLSACTETGSMKSTENASKQNPAPISQETLTPMPLPTEVTDPKNDVGGKRRIPTIVENIKDIPIGAVSAVDWGHWYDKQVFDFQTKDLGQKSTDLNITIWSAAWESKQNKTSYPEETYFLTGLVNTDTSFDLTGKMVSEAGTKTVRVICVDRENCWMQSDKKTRNWVKVPYKDAMMNIKYQNFLYLFSDNFPADAKLRISKDRVRSNVELKGLCNDRPSVTKASFIFNGDKSTTKMSKIYETGEKAVEETRIMQKIPLQQVLPPVS